MKMIASKGAWTVMRLAGVVGVLLAARTLLTAPPTEASSPDVIEQHQQEVMNHCLEISNLRNPQPMGSIITFGDDVGYDALMVRGHYPQPHMSNQVGRSLCLFNRRTRHAYTSDASQPSRYTSRHFGFQFDYPVDFVVESRSGSETGSDRSIESIDVWMQRDYDAIQSEAPPIESPPNVSVTVRQNPRRLALRDWVMQSNQFALSDRFTTLTVAGQPAIAFHSTGLYEYENIVLSIPNRSEVIVLSLGTVGMPESDVIYRPVFQQMISSLQF
jgi:hypothetical protein